MAIPPSVGARQRSRPDAVVLRPDVVMLRPDVVMPWLWATTVGRLYAASEHAPTQSSPGHRVTQP
jgi:hypothetical protein